MRLRKSCPLDLQFHKLQLCAEHTRHSGQIYRNGRILLKLIQRGQHRKTPDELLSEVQAAEAAAGKGRLKIVLGYASGVGKSFRMIDEARRRRERGQDVVIGAVQPREPPEVEAILAKLEVIPFQVVNGGAAIDVDAIIRRHAAVCFIDGLAYDNPPGVRNPARWQDVQDLLAAG